MPGKFGSTLMYSQMQPWSAAGAPPCMEPVSGPMVPPRIGLSYQTTRPHPWRPKFAYELVENKNLVAQPITSQFVKPCFTPSNMETEPMTFPNLVTGFERNPQHAARAALYTRFTSSEWTNSNLTLLTESNFSRNKSERLRDDALRLMRDTEEKTTHGQNDASRRLGERITDLTFWRNEESMELDRLISESQAIEELKRKCGSAMVDIEAPLHIAQECLYHREVRSGVEKVHDPVEKALLLEVDNCRKSKDKLRDLFEKIIKQGQDCRSAQHALEDDVVHKEFALGIDAVCHQINNHSRGLTYYGGIEKYDPTISNQETWTAVSSSRVNKSQTERAKLAQLKSDAIALINAIAETAWDHWNNTNMAFTKRLKEYTEAKDKTQMSLYKTQQELFDLEKNIFLLQKAIQDKSYPLMVAQTRLEARTHREGVELCNDSAQMRLVEEVQDIQKIVQDLHYKLQEAEAQHQSLLKLRSTLEADLHRKVNAIFIDREKCMSLRRSFPVTTMIKY